MPYDTGGAVELGPDGKIKVLASAGTDIDLYIDIQGYFTAGPDGGGFHSVPHARVWDSTYSAGGDLGPNEVRKIKIAGRVGIPNDTTAGAAVLSVTAINYTKSGTVSITSADLASDNGTSSLALKLPYDGVARQSTSIVGLSNNGEVVVRNKSAGTVRIFVNVQGWFAMERVRQYFGATFEDGSEFSQDAETGQTTVTAPVGTNPQTSQAAQMAADGMFTEISPVTPAEPGAPTEATSEADPEDVPMPDGLDEGEELPAVDGDSGTEYSNAPAVTFADSNAFAPFANVPLGYRLYGNNREDSFHYRSATWYIWIREGRGGKVKTTGEVKVKYAQSLPGGPSRRWNLTTRVEWHKCYDLNYYYAAWCGVVMKR